MVAKPLLQDRPAMSGESAGPLRATQDWGMDSEGFQ